MVGKPAEFMLANIADAFGLQRSQICMVGDRLDTDILFGQDGGLTTMLVLSGTSALCPSCSDSPSAAPCIACACWLPMHACTSNGRVPTLPALPPWCCRFSAQVMHLIAAS